MNLAGGVEGRSTPAFAVDVVGPDVVVGLRATACTVAGVPTPSIRRHSRVMVSLYIMTESLESLVELVSPSVSLVSEAAVAAPASATVVNEAAGWAGPPSICRGGTGHGAWN